MPVRCRLLWILAVASAVSVLVCGPADAYFERFFFSTRSFSLGEAYVAIADDAGAAVTNAAGLTQLTSPHILSSFVQPYDISDLHEHFVAAALPTRHGVIAVAWHRFALRDVTSEDVFTIAYGRDYIRNSQDASLSFGGTLDVARVAVEDVYHTSRTVLTGSIGVLLRPFPIIGFGYSLRNLGQPSFDLVAGGGKTSLKVTHALGVAYHWRRRVIIAYESRREQDRRWYGHAGLEVRTREALVFRAGLTQGDVTGGIGITVSDVTLDFGVSSHDVLGTSYLVSLGWALPGGREGAGKGW